MSLQKAGRLQKNGRVGRKIVQGKRETRFAQVCMYDDDDRDHYGDRSELGYNKQVTS